MSLHLNELNASHARGDTRAPPKVALHLGGTDRRGWTVGSRRCTGSNAKSQTKYKNETNPCAVAALRLTDSQQALYSERNDTWRFESADSGLGHMGRGKREQHGCRCQRLRFNWLSDYWHWPEQTQRGLVRRQYHHQQLSHTRQVGIAIVMNVSSGKRANRGGQSHNPATSRWAARRKQT